MVNNVLDAGVSVSVSVYDVVGASVDIQINRQRISYRGAVGFGFGIDVGLGKSKSLSATMNGKPADTGWSVKADLKIGGVTARGGVSGEIDQNGPSTSGGVDSGAGTPEAIINVGYKGVIDF